MILESNSITSFPYMKQQIEPKNLLDLKKGYGKSNKIPQKGLQLGNS